MAGKRSPTAHRTPEQTRKHGRTYQATKKQKQNRAKRNAARRAMEREGLVRKGDGKDVAHKRGLMNGGTNARKNLSVQSRKKNRASAKKKR